MLPTKVLYRIMKEAMPNSIKHYKNDYKTRLKTQKFIFLFDQMWGENLYNHSWYLAGPYSSTLTHQIYDELLESIEINQEKWDKLVLSEDVKDTISKVQALVKNAKAKADCELSESSSYELVASIWYIAKRIKRDGEIERELLLNKPHFKDVKNLPKIIQLITKTMISVE